MVNFLLNEKQLKLHHYGYAVNKINSKIIDSFYPFILDKKPVLKFSDYNQNVKVAFFKSYKNILIELIQPMNKKSPINNFLKKNKFGGFHHICFEARNLQQTILILKKKKFIATTSLKIGFENREIIFMMPKTNNNFLIELISKKNKL